MMYIVQCTPNMFFVSIHIMYILDTLHVYLQRIFYSILLYYNVLDFIETIYSNILILKSVSFIHGSLQ